jgi:hypothetical protein
MNPWFKLSLLFHYLACQDINLARTGHQRHCNDNDLLNKYFILQKFGFLTLTNTLIGFTYGWIYLWMDLLMDGFTGTVSAQ